MTPKTIKQAVEKQIEDYDQSRLRDFVDKHGPYAIKFVQSQWAANYTSPKQLKISETPALTWGTATYVTPIEFPLSSVLYGRIGLVTDFAATGWKVFDATKPSARAAYIRWAEAQSAYHDLLLTVHSTYINHHLRDKFRRNFRIDCVLFHPDQEAEIHTDKSSHVWMAVTDWNAGNRIRKTFSSRLKNARFVVLIDEDFDVKDDTLPIRMAPRKIERVTAALTNNQCTGVDTARSDPNLPSQIVNRYTSTDGYLHIFIEP